MKPTNPNCMMTAIAAIYIIIYITIISIYIYIHHYIHNYLYSIIYSIILYTYILYMCICCKQFQVLLQVHRPTKAVRLLPVSGTLTQAEDFTVVMQQV